jgi:hypothetical protein
VDDHDRCSEIDCGLGGTAHFVPNGFDEVGEAIRALEEADDGVIADMRLIADRL